MLNSVVTIAKAAASSVTSRMPGREAFHPDGQIGLADGAIYSTATVAGFDHQCAARAGRYAGDKPGPESVTFHFSVSVKFKWMDCTSNMSKISAPLQSMLFTQR